MILGLKGRDKTDRSCRILISCVTLHVLGGSFSNYLQKVKINSGWSAWWLQSSRNQAFPSTSLDNQPFHFWQTDKFFQITNWGNLPHQKKKNNITVKVLVGGFPMNGHSLGVCLWNQKLEDFVSHKVPL